MPSLLRAARLLCLLRIWVEQAQAQLSALVRQDLRLPQRPVRPGLRVEQALQQAVVVVQTHLTAWLLILPPQQLRLLSPARASEVLCMCACDCTPRCVTRRYSSLNARCWSCRICLSLLRLLCQPWPRSPLVEQVLQELQELEEHTLLMRHMRHMRQQQRRRHACPQPQLGQPLLLSLAQELQRQCLLQAVLLRRELELVRLLGQRQLQQLLRARQRRPRLQRRQLRSLHRVKQALVQQLLQLPSEALAAQAVMMTMMMIRIWTRTFSSHRPQLMMRSSGAKPQQLP